MTDTVLSVQRALYNKLNGAIAGVPAYDHVPEGAQPPAIVIESIDTFDEGAKGSPFDRHEVELYIYWRELGRKGLRQVMKQVRQLLEDQELPSDDAHLSTPTYLGSNDEELPDGVTYLGRQRWLIYGEPV